MPLTCPVTLTLKPFFSLLMSPCILNKPSLFFVTSTTDEVPKNKRMMEKGGVEQATVDLPFPKKIKTISWEQGASRINDGMRSGKLKYLWVGPALLRFLLNVENYIKNHLLYLLHRP
jgi:hypothetical protein